MPIPNCLGACRWPTAMIRACLLLLGLGPGPNTAGCYLACGGCVDRRISAESVALTFSDPKTSYSNAIVARFRRLKSITKRKKNTKAKSACLFQVYYRAWCPPSGSGNSFQPCWVPARSLLGVGNPRQHCIIHVQLVFQLRSVLPGSQPSKAYLRRQWLYRVQENAFY